MNKKNQVLTVLLIFFSGLAALVYQTLWVKQLVLVLGVEVYAVSIGVASYFLGLALDGVIIGRISNKVKRATRTFAYLELSIGIWNHCHLPIIHCT